MTDKVPEPYQYELLHFQNDILLMQDSSNLARERVEY